MKKIDLVPGIVWCVGGIVVLVASIRLGLGTLGSPGAGLFPFVLGVLLFGISLPIMFGALRAVEFGEWRFRITKPLIIVVAMLAYALALKPVGFVITTFFFILALSRLVDPRPWRLSLIFAACTAGVSHIVFVTLLHVELPAGAILDWMR